MSVLIYHICRCDEWATAEQAGSYAGSSQDVVDGFIHFSTAGQVRASAAKHRAGMGFFRDRRPQLYTRIAQDI